MGNKNFGKAGGNKPVDRRESPVNFVTVELDDVKGCKIPNIKAD